MYGERIRELRNEKQKKQTEMAEEIGSTQKQISKWEREKIEPNIYFLWKLADYFNTSVDYIIGRNNEFGEKTTYNNVVNENHGSITYNQK